MMYGAGEKYKEGSFRGLQGARTSGKPSLLPMTTILALDEVASFSVAARGGVRGSVSVWS
jgi:hypothetical protein